MRNRAPGSGAAERPPQAGVDAAPRWPRPGRRVRDLGTVDVVFVVAEQNRGWVLEGLCREIDRHVDGRSVFHYAGSPLPRARAYFFSHYLLYLRCQSDPALRQATSVVWFTHPSWKQGQGRTVARAMRSASWVVSGSTTQAQVLLSEGFPAERIAVIVPGADPELFLPHRRGGGAVGFCSAYYPRKAPEVVVGLIAAMPHRQFHLLGRNWRSAPEFAQLEAAPNFTYIESGYDDYPSFYDRLDVFVSPSRLEGGPIPLLEAMMSNVVPVATRTGFGPDVIAHGENGFLCDVDAPVETFAELVDMAYDCDADVRASVEHLTWDRFAREVLELLARPHRARDGLVDRLRSLATRWGGS